MSQIKDCIFNILCLILIFKVAVNVQCSKNQNTIVGTVRNLSVTVLQDNTLGKSGIFKFNISWLPPANEKSPKSFSILVSSVSNEETENKTFCPKESLYYTTQDGNEFNVLLPKRKFLSEVSELNIRLKCSYKIQVFANPRKNSIETPFKMFTVPNCVGSTCGCQELQKFLPGLQTQAEVLQNGDILINWKLSSNDSRIYGYSISIGFPVLVSKNGLPVFKKTQIIKLSSTNSSFLWKKEENINYNISDESMIFVSAEYDRACQGSEATSKINYSKENTRTNIILPLLGIISAIIIFIGILTFLCLRSKKAYNAILFDKKLPRSRRIDLILRNHNILYVNQENNKSSKKLGHEKYEINYNEIKMKKELGRGQFGRVYLASLKDKNNHVAVKISASDSVHEEEARKQLLEEIETIKVAGPHPHLVSLVGYCLSPTNPICLILEYMEGGDLLSYLHFLRDKEINFEIKYSNISHQRPSITETSFDFGKQTLPLLYKESNCDFVKSPKKYSNVLNSGQQNYEDKSKHKFVERGQFLCFALQIALGMEHLESKMIIHRDLAARNILIDSNFNLKISDFGLSRNGVYVMGNGMGGVRRLPIRWMSPETLRERAFSSKSDVWSFAVVLWEIGTLGMFPYSNIQDDDLLKYILSDKGRLPRPESIDFDIYNIMNSSWASAPEQRPSFGKLVSTFSILKSCSSSNNCGKSNPCYSLLTSSNRSLLR